MPKPIADPEVGSVADSAPANPGVRPHEVFLLVAWLLVCSACVFWKTFHLPYAFDDLDHLHAVTTLRTGQISFLTWLFHNHNEHFVPLLRLYFLVGTWLSGLKAWAIHLMVFLTYVAGAAGCAWISFSVTRSRLGAFLAGTIYAGAAGYAGSTVWQPTVAQFSISGTPLIFAIAVVVSPMVRHRRTIPLAMALVLLSACGMGATAIASLSIPIYLYLAKPPALPEKQRSLLIASMLILVVAILGATKWLMVSHGIIHAVTITWKGVWSGGFLILTAPGRFLQAWTPTQELGVTADLAVAAVGWVLLLASLRITPRPLRVLLASLWIGDCLLVALIGLGRYQDSFIELALTDRYYFFFLLPFALQTAAVGQYALQRMFAGRDRKSRFVLAVSLSLVLIALLGMSYVRLDKNMPWDILKDHKKQFWEARLLAKLVSDQATHQNLHLADGPINFPGVHKDHIALACVIFTQYPHGLPNVSWTLSKTPPVNVGAPWRMPLISTNDAAVENEIFDNWSHLEQRPPHSCVVGGKIADVQLSKGQNCGGLVDSMTATPEPDRSPAAATGH